MNLPLKKYKKTAGFLLITGSFLLAFYGWRWLGFAIPENPTLAIVLPYCWWLAIVAVTTRIFVSWQDLFATLGLRSNILRAFAIAAIFTLPMFLGSAFTGTFTVSRDPLTLLHLTLFAGFMEELLFRGFFFGLLFYKLRLGFLPAILPGAFIFGAGHLYQSSIPMEALSIFAITFVGSAWFAWLYVEWNRNLWVPALLHVFMNTSWVLFEVADNAAGTLYLNIFRGLTIGVSIFVTIRFRKKQGGMFMGRLDWVRLAR
jgi:membrane protease YdiL (CAAX protease family)